MPVATAAADDDFDDEQDLTGMSVPAGTEGDLARRMGSNIATNVHGVAQAKPEETPSVVMPLGEVDQATTSKDSQQQQQQH